MFNEQDPIVDFKLKMLKKAFPAKDCIVFGDMYVVEGGYTKKCLEYGSEEVLLIDTLETPNWLQTRKQNPNINFYKGNFSNALFMNSFDEKYDVGVVFDILLHQAPLLNTIHLMLEKINKRICIVQPMLQEQTYDNALIFLPGNKNFGELYPLEQQNEEYKAFDVNQVNQSHWLWGMTVSFLTSVLKGEGFEIIHGEKLSDMPNNKWFIWGCVAERRQENPFHWSKNKPKRRLYPANW